MSERLTKQQLKHDPLMQRTADTAEFVTDHLKTIIISGVVILGVALTVFLVRAGGERAEERAAGMLAEARTDFMRGALEPAAARLEDIVRNMAGTRSGKHAILLYGDVRYAQGHYDQAEPYYRQAVDNLAGDPVFGPAARRGLAATLESLDRPLEAAEVYQNLADDAQPESLRLDLLLDVARNRLHGGQPELALAIYTELSQKSHINPAAAQTASLRLAEIRHLAATP